jgi:hypothetical protein
MAGLLSLPLLIPGLRNTEEKKKSEEVLLSRWEP